MEVRQSAVTWKPPGEQVCTSKAPLGHQLAVFRSKELGQWAGRPLLSDLCQPSLALLFSPRLMQAGWCRPSSPLSTSCP